MAKTDEERERTVSERGLGAGAGAAIGLVAVGLVGFGCSEDRCAGVELEAPPEPNPRPGSPPVVVDGEWLGAGVLELRFSEPLSATGQLDPSRFAVVAWNATAAEYGDACYLRTRYRELGSSYFGYGGGLAEIWVGADDPTRLRMRLANNGAACPIVSDSIAEGLVLAYTASPGTAPLLRDAEGLPIAALGPQWAITALDRCRSSDYDYCRVYQSQAGHLPALTSLAPIPCP